MYKSFFLLTLLLYTIPLSAQKFALNVKNKHFTAPVTYKYYPFTLTQFDSSIFEQKVDFLECIFMSKASFPNTQFLMPCSLKKSKFYKGGDFSYSVFKQKADFSRITSLDTWLFKHTQFSGNIILWESKFEDIIYINHTQFHQDAIFINSHDFLYNRI